MDYLTTFAVRQAIRVAHEAQTETSVSLQDQDAALALLTITITGAAEDWLPAYLWLDAYAFDGSETLDSLRQAWERRHGAV